MNFTNILQQSINHFHVVILVSTVILHIIFASGIAHDIGNLHRLNIKPVLLPGNAWVMATLIIGIWVVLSYWLMHHSSLARSATMIKESYEYHR